MAKRAIGLQFIRHRRNQQIAFDQLAIRGQLQGILGGASNLLPMQLERRCACACQGAGFAARRGGGDSNGREHGGRRPIVPATRPAGVTNS